MTAGLVLALVMALGVPAAAQQAPTKDQLIPEEGGTITLDVKERPLKDVVDYIRDKTNVNLIVSQEAEAELVSITIKDLHWLQALELVADKAECILVYEARNLIKIEKPPQVSFDFQDADIRKVISVIAAYSGANIVVGQEVQGTVTVRLNRVPWRSALETVVKTLGFVVVEDERDILRVTDPARLQEQLETRVYTFRFVRPPPPYRAKITTDVQIANITAPSDDMEREFNLLKAFRAAVAPEGTLEYVKTTNSVVVTGTAPKLAKLEQLIEQVDVEPVMVGVDIQFVTTQNTDFLDVGIDPGDQGMKVSMDLGKMTHRLPFDLGRHGWEDKLSAEGKLDSSGDFRGTGPSPLPSGTGFSFGTLDFTGVQFTLRLLKRDTSSRLVQAPRILTLDNQAATIFVGETIRYARTQAESNQQGGLQFAIDEAESSPVQTGFQLLVLPHVIPGSKKLMLTVIPQQKTLTGTSAEQPGFNVFRGGAGASEVQIALPQEAARTVVTHMMLDSGETAVIGGLLTETEAKTTNAIPLLGQIPIIGYLFKNDRVSKTKDNLIILVTPHILKGAEDRRLAISEEMRRHAKKIRDEYEEISGEEMDKLVPADARSEDEPSEAPEEEPEEE
ncbi:MAG: secretin N-terminal domain-containing protein [Planctomycetota bacterium]|jgi:type IV pilus assembly protein PilQ